MDWLKLARVLLAQRKLPVVALFGDAPPSHGAVIGEIPLPYFARHVQKPLRPNAKRVPTTRLEGLFELAGDLLQAGRRDIGKAQEVLRPCVASQKRSPRSPRRSNSAS